MGLALTGKQNSDRLEAMAADAILRPAIGDIRRLGAMVALELVEDGDPAKPAAGRILSKRPPPPVG